MSTPRHLFLILPTLEKTRKLYTVGLKDISTKSGTNYSIGMTLCVPEDVTIAFGDTASIDLGVSCVCICPPDGRCRLAYLGQPPNCQQHPHHQNKKCGPCRVLPGLHVLASAFERNVYEQADSNFNTIDGDSVRPLIARVHNLLDEHITIRAGSPLFKLMGPNRSRTDFEVLAPDDPRVEYYFPGVAREARKTLTRSGSKRSREDFFEPPQVKRMDRA